MINIISNLYASQFRWLPIGIILFFIAAYRCCREPIIAAFFLYLTITLDALMLHLPKVSIFIGLGWNWQGKLLQFLWPWIIVYGFAWLSPKEVGLLMPSKGKDYLYAVLAGILFVLISITLSMSLGFPSPELLTIQTILYQLTMPGFAEEIVYRGIYFAILNHYLGKQWIVCKISIGWGFILVSILFVLVHLVDYNTAAQQFIIMGDYLSIAFLLIFSLTIGIIREKTGSIWPCVLFHNISNGFYILVARFIY